ncbi:42579_t:CDS:2, partial [Gigaspora margarita]
MSSQRSISPMRSISPTPSILSIPSISLTPSMEEFPQILQENSIFSSASSSSEINNKTNNGANNKTTGTCKIPYPYTNSNRSTGHLTYHLHNKHEITANNYKEHLDLSQE